MKKLVIGIAIATMSLSGVVFAEDKVQTNQEDNKPMQMHQKGEYKHMDKGMMKKGGGMYSELQGLRGLEGAEREAFIAKFIEDNDLTPEQIEKLNAHLEKRDERKAQMQNKKEDRQMKREQHHAEMVEFYQSIGLTDEQIEKIEAYHQDNHKEKRGDMKQKFKDHQSDKGKGFKNK